MVFSQKHFLTFVGNIGINSVSTESVYQNWQFGKTECLAGVSWEGLTREIHARHSCLHLVLTLHIPACASHMSHFAGCLVARYLRKLFSLQLLESSHSLSITQPLQSNPIINIGYKRLNRIIIKFGTELKPTKHIVVNHNFTIRPISFCQPLIEMNIGMKLPFNFCDFTLLLYKSPRGTKSNWGRS